MTSLASSSPSSTAAGPPFDAGMSLSCYTAPGILFANPNALRQHYKSDWHRYNLKRKVAGLPPITSAQFHKRREAALRLRAQAGEPQKGKSHLNQKKIAKIGAHKKKHKDRAERRARSAAAATASESSGGESKQGASGFGSGDKSNSAAAHAAARLGIDEGAAALLLAEINKEGTSTDGAPVEDLDLETITATQLRRVANPCANLFSHGEFASIEENLAQMHSKYGFRLPDAEYIDDLPGLMKYAVAKVRLGKMCLYCDRGFQTAAGCQNHMRDQNHCRLPVSNDDYFYEEYGEFYDYSSAKVEEAGEMEMLETGEILLRSPDGKTGKIIGNRSFRNVYAQNIQADDNRGSVLAARAQAKERLLLMCNKLGIKTTTSSSSQLSRYVEFQRRHNDMGLQLMRKKTAVKNKREMRMGIHTNMLQKNKIAGSGSRFALGVGVHG
jgi:hypothetical protein